MRSIFLGSFVLLVLFTDSGSTPQLGKLQDRVEVAKIRVRHAESGTENAAAIYVGKDQQNAYFITAYHAINPEKGGSVQSVEVQFSNSPRLFQAELVDRFDIALDLGIISTPIGNLPLHIGQLSATDARIETDIRVIGHSSAGDWSVCKGYVVNENAPGGDSDHFVISRDPGLDNGFSGGPVFDTKGNFLGMHVSQDRTYGRELKSARIVKMLQAWKVPVDNFATNTDKGLKESFLTNEGPLQTKGIAAFSTATAIDRDFDGNFDDFFTDPLFKLHIRKTDTNHPGAYGPGEFRAALLFDLRVLPQNVSIRTATLSVSPPETNGTENISVEIYGFVDYMRIGLQTEAFIGGVKVVGPIKFLGARAFSERMNALDVSDFIRQAISDGHRLVGFSIRQAESTFDKGVPFGTGFTIWSGDAPESRISIEGRPHLTIKYQEP